MSKQMTGISMCAIAITALGADAGAKIIQRMPKEAAARLLAETTRMPQPTREQLSQAVNELHDLVTQGAPTALAGREFADSLLAGAFGDDAASVRNLMISTMSGKSFEFLEEHEHGRIATLLEEESVNIQALVLGHLTQEFRHSVLMLLPELQQGHILVAMGAIKQPHPDAVAVIAKKLRERVSDALLSRKKAESIGGVHAIVDVINRSSTSTEKRLLAELDERDPVMAAQVRELMFTFADFVNVSDAAMQEVLRGVPTSVMACALSGAKDELKQKVTSNISNLLLKELEAEQESMRKVSRSEQEDARGELVLRARTLEAEEKITLRGEEDYV